MSQRKPALIGRLAVQLKLINMDQLNEATAEQGRSPDKNLGEIFVELGFINAKQLEKLASVQRDLIEKHRAKKAGGAAPAGATGGAAGAAGAAKSAARARVLASAARAAQDAAPVPESPPREMPSPPPAAAPDPVAAPAPAASAPAASAPPAAPPQRPPARQEAPVLADAEEAAPVAAQAASAAEGHVSLGLRLPASDDGDLQRLHQILANALNAGASDVHLHGQSDLKLRINGDLVAQEGQSFDAETVARLVSATLTPAQRQELEHEGQVDFCFELEGVGRFRANAYRQQRGFDVVYRSIPAAPPSLEELGLPSELAKFTNFHQGMVLLTGPAGCGKSSTLAAMVNLINEEREEHILTVEDPIEVIHRSKRCLVNQRHAGRHTQSFARALQGALREDPDVIVIGELRDLETISLAMTAAETGHFVLATLHTNNAVRTINRIIGAFPSNEQAQVRTMLSESLRAVVSQRLVPTADGSGRIPALEVLVINKAIGNLVRDEKTVQIRSSIQTGKAHGMYLLEQSLNELVAAGRITRETALRYAEEEKMITAGR